MNVTKQSIQYLFILLFVFSSVSYAGGPEKKGGDNIIDSDSEIDAYKMHHIKDSHEFKLFSYPNSQGTRSYVSFPLPIIIWANGGLTAFMSSEFNHDDYGKVVVNKNNQNFVKIHSKIHVLNQGETAVVFDENHHSINSSKVLDLSITKSVIGALIIGLLMLFWFSRLAKQYATKKIPTGFGRVLEPLILYVRDEIARPNIGEKHYRRFTGYLLTIFFFIWLLNMAGLTPLGFNITGQIAITASMAIFTLVIYTFSGNKHFWGHILWMPGVPILIRPILAIIEIVGTFVIRPFSLLIRLFANITAGHIILMSLIAITFTLKESLGVVGATSLSFVLSFFILLIKVLVSFLQAYIFTMLSALFIGMAVEEHEHH